MVTPPSSIRSDNLLQGWPGEDGDTGLGRAVGPDWTESLAAFSAGSAAGLQVEYNCEVSALVRPLLFSAPWFTVAVAVDPEKCLRMIDTVVHEISNASHMQLSLLDMHLARCCAGGCQ